MSKSPAESPPDPGARNRDDWYRDVRRLRKKLLQIEHLRNLRRTLTEEELAKLKRADRYRETLGQLMARADETTGSGSKTSPDWQESAVTGVQESLGKSCQVATDSISGSLFVGTSHVCCSTPRGSGDGGNDTPTAPVAADADEPSSGVQFPPRLLTSEFDGVGVVGAMAPPVFGRGGEEPETSEAGSVVGASGEAGARRKVDFKRRKAFAVKLLPGHSDLIMCADFDDEILISVGRDTTARVWDVGQGAEVNALRGHRNVVTGVVILPPVASSQMCQMLAVPDQKLCLTSSLDCDVNLWLLGGSFEAIRSVYTFCGITCLQCWHGTEFPEAFAVVGNEGGKIEVYDMISREAVVSKRAFEDQVSSLIVDAGTNRLYASSWDGKFIVWELVHVLGSNSGPRVQPNVLYESDVIWGLDRKVLRPSMVKSIHPSSQLCVGDEEKCLILYVDKGTSLKALEWERGSVLKYKNQRGDFSLSDAVAYSDGYVFSSCFDLESGHGCVHVRDAQTMEYICTVADGETERVLGMQARGACVQLDCGKTVDVFRLVTFGTQLKVWDWFNPRDRKSLKYMSKWSDSIIYPETLDALSSVLEDSNESCSDEEYLSSEEDEEPETFGAQVDETDSSSDDSRSRSAKLAGASDEDEDSRLAQESSYWRWCSIS